MITTRKMLVAKIAGLLTPDEIRSLAAPAPARVGKYRHTIDRLKDPIKGGRPLTFKALVVEPKSDTLVNRDHLGRTAYFSGLYDVRGPRNGRYFIGEIRIGGMVGRVKMSASQIERLFGRGGEAKAIPVYAVWDNTISAKLVGWVENPTL